MNNPRRKRPAEGLIHIPNQPIIVFVTVCSKNRIPWIASQEVHDLLLDVWSTADAWQIGRYTLMPDHIHLFAAPSAQSIPLKKWIQFWKSIFTKRHGIKEHVWQSLFWDRRIRNGESYESKWEYVRHNPVRHGLADTPEDWPYQGELNLLPW